MTFWLRAARLCCKHSSAAISDCLAAIVPSNLHKQGASLLHMVRLLLPSIAMALAAKHTMKKLVAFDLDGTLLNPEHRLTQPTLDKLRELDGLGVSIVFATGRSAPAVYEHVAALGIQSTLPCVLYNGAVCYAFPQPCADAAEASARKEELFSLGIDLADAAAVCAFAAERDLLVQYYVGDHIYVRPTCDEHRDLVRRYHELTGASHTTVDDYPLTESPAKMLLMTDDPDGVLAVVREAQASGALPSGLASIRGSPPFFVEMLGQGVYKGSGLAKLCERSGVALDDVIAFGRARRPLHIDGVGKHHRITTQAMEKMTSSSCATRASASRC